jgi:hypothetical protein
MYFGFQTLAPFFPFTLLNLEIFLSIFDNFRIFGVDSTHNELRDQLTSAQRNIVGTNIKKHHKY